MSTRTTDYGRQSKYDDDYDDDYYSYDNSAAMSFSGFGGVSYTHDEEDDEDESDSEYSDSDEESEEGSDESDGGEDSGNEDPSKSDGEEVAEQTKKLNVGE